MRRRMLVVGLCALVMAPVAGGADLAPGLWELALEAQVAADPGLQPGTITVNQCVTKDDVRDPSKLLGGLATAGASNCSYLEKGYVGQTFRFVMQCSGTLELKATGEATFSPQALHGAFTTSSVLGGKRVELKSTLTGRRVGNC